jgi:hypothetical protein
MLEAWRDGGGYLLVSVHPSPVDLTGSFDQLVVVGGFSPKSVTSGNSRRQPIIHLAGICQFGAQLVHLRRRDRICGVTEVSVDPLQLFNPGESRGRKDY